MKELNYFDLIYKYCNAELSKEERIAFENELLSNPELYEEYEIFKKVQEQFEDNEMINFQKLVQVISKNYTTKTHKPRKLLGAVKNIKVFYFLFFLSIAIFMFLFYVLYLK